MNLFRKQASEKEKREFEQFQRGLQVEARLDSGVGVVSSEPMSSRSLSTAIFMTYSTGSNFAPRDFQPPPLPPPPLPLTKQRIMELALGMGLKVVDTDPTVPGEDTTGPIVVKGKRRFEPA